MTAPGLPLAAIGIGNVLRGDDAIGVRVIEALRAVAAHDPRALPEGTRLVDGGTLGLDLLSVVREARGVVLVDAVRLGAPAGSVSMLRGDAVLRAGGDRDGQAAGAIGELLAVARLMDWLPGSVALVGIEVAGLEPGLRLSPEAEAALPAAVEAVGAELTRMDRLSMTVTTTTTDGTAIGPGAGATA